MAASVTPRETAPSSLVILILLVTLTRAPLMVPLTAFQNVLVARFTGFDVHARRRWVVGGSALIVAASVGLAGAAAVLGPPLLPLIFGPEYRTEGAVVAALTAATAGLGIITLTGVAAITSARHGVYVLGWATAIVVSLLTLFLLPVAFDWAAVIALASGPLAGAIVHLVALRSRWA